MDWRGDDMTQAERERLDDRLALISVLQELTVAALDLFDPARSLDDFMQKVATRLGCRAALCFEADAEHGGVSLLGAAGLAHSSRSLQLPTSAPADLEQFPLPYPDLARSNLICWALRPRAPDQRRESPLWWLALYFDREPRQPHQYKNMMERLTHYLRVALEHRRMYQRTLENERILRITSSRLQSLVNNLQSGVVTEDANRCIADVNQAFCDMFGIEASPAALRGANCTQIFETSKGLFLDSAHFVARLEEVSCRGQLVLGEELLLADGRVFERDFVPIRLEDATVGQLWAYRDVTRAYQAAAEIRRLNENLEQRVATRTQELAIANSELQNSLHTLRDTQSQLTGSLSLLRATLESTTDGIAVTSESLAITDFNENFLRMWCIPRPLAELGQVGELLDLAQAQLSQPEQFLARTTQLASGAEESFDVLEFKDGRVYERYSKPRWVDGRCLGRVWSFHDVTERQRAAEELRRVHSQLLDTSRRAGMSEVATNILHNVGNVLNSVNVSASVVFDRLESSKIPSLSKVVQLLKDEPDLAAFFSKGRGLQLATYLRELSAHLEADRNATIAELEALRRNLDHIKDIVRRQQGYANVAGVREWVDPVELVEDSVRILVDSLERNHLTLIREFSEVPLICLDKHKTVELLVNLLGNAKQACLDSGKSDRWVKIDVAALPQGGVRIAISDNGVGIAAENLTRIFQHGFTTRKQGHGFGLHSGFLSAREMGGELRVHSDGLGAGATFTLEIPNWEE